GRVLRPHVERHAPGSGWARGNLLSGGDGSDVFFEDLFHALLPQASANTAPERKPPKLLPFVVDTSAATRGSRRLLVSITVLVTVHRVIFPQRIAVPIRGIQNADQVRMIAEADPEHVEDFALIPIRSVPDGSRGVDLGIRSGRATREPALHAHTRVPLDRMQ